MTQLVDRDTRESPAPAIPTPVVWHLCFVAFAVLTDYLMWRVDDPVHPLMNTVGVVGYAAATVYVGACLGLAGHRRHAALARRSLIGFHLAFLPIQFLASFGQGFPWPGMLLSVVIITMMRPRFPRLSPTARTVWLTVHIGVSVGWLGTATVQTALGFVGLGTSDAATRHGAYEMMYVTTLTVAIPSVMLTILSGVVLALGTSWGLVRHRWVLIKLIIALAVPFIATVESEWMTTLADRTADPDAEPGGLGLALALCMLLYGALLWSAVVLSVLKPFGRTRWGRRTESDQSVRSTPVEISDASEVAEDVKEIRLTPRDGADPWKPGAHLDVVLPSGTVRQYSLLGDRSGDCYRIAVLREPDGRGGSVELHSLEPGASVGVRGPRTSFELVDAPSYLLIAGGIGIVPFLSMANELGTRGADWRLVYRGRSLPAMAYGAELAGRHGDRVRLAPADIEPRPDLAALLGDTPSGVAVYCCGPTGMIDAVRELMPTACPHGTLYVERFAAESTAFGSEHAFTAELRRSGIEVAVPAGTPLLSALHEVDPTLDYSCSDGVCGACKLTVLGGVPDHRDGVLQDHERDRRDVIYPCVSRAVEDRLILDA